MSPSDPTVILKKPMSTPVKVIVALAAGGALAALAYVGISALAASRRRGTLAPGEIPVTAVPGGLPSAAGVDASTGEQRSLGPCRAIMRWDWHLRPEERESRESATPYPAGTEVQILRAGSLTRNGALIHRVKVIRDGAEGWAYLMPYEVVGDCRRSVPATSA